MKNKNQKIQIGLSVAAVAIVLIALFAFGKEVPFEYNFRGQALERFLK